MIILTQKLFQPKLDGTGHKILIHCSAGRKVKVSREDGFFCDKQFRLGTFVLELNSNKSVPIGTIACVREYLIKLGSDEVFDNVKSKGQPLFPLICAIISYRLMENFSAEGCGRWLESMEVRNGLGIRGKVGHRMKPCHGAFGRDHAGGSGASAETSVLDL